MWRKRCLGKNFALYIHVSTKGIIKNQDVCSNLDLSEKKDRAISMKEIERNVVYSCHEHFAGYKRVLCSTISHTVCKFPSHFPYFCVKKSSIIFSTFWCTVHSSIGSRSRWPQSNLSAENDIYSNLSLSLINLGGVACFKLGKMGKNWISLKDYIGGELFGPFLPPCVRPIAEDIPALIFSSRKVSSFSR